MNDTDYEFMICECVKVGSDASSVSSCRRQKEHRKKDIFLVIGYSDGVDKRLDTHVESIGKMKS